MLYFFMAARLCTSIPHMAVSVQRTLYAAVLSLPALARLFSQVSFNTLAGNSGKRNAFVTGAITSLGAEFCVTIVKLCVGLH